MNTNTSKGVYGLDKSNYPSNMGKPWLDDEVLQLLQNIRKKKAISDIAQEHGRTEGGIRGRLKQLAFDYYKEGRTIEVIEKFTGLSKEHIESTIESRKIGDIIRERKRAAKEANATVKPENTDKVTMKDLMNALKSIDEKLTMLLDR
jgi:predicted transcriptional regulator